MRIRCKYCKTWFDTKDKYCPYCYARVRDIESVSIKGGRAKAAIFDHADTHLEENKRYVRESGKEAKACEANKVNHLYGSGSTYQNTRKTTQGTYTNSSLKRKPIQRKGVSLSQIIGWGIVFYVLFQVFLTIMTFLFI